VATLSEPGSLRDPAPRISFRNVTKVYPGPVTAVDGVSVAIEPGSIHAFVGENGAGKSTLMKMLSGEVRADRGDIAFDGVMTRFRSPHDAMAAGVGMVHQEILLVNELTVWENVVLGVEPTRQRFFLHVAGSRSSVLASIERYGLGLDPDAIVGELSVGARQKVEICKLLHRNVAILIFDEPTAVLTPQEIPKFFDELRRLAVSGRTICFISHHLDEVMELADTISVLRDGQLVGTMPTSNTTIRDLTRLMVDRDVVHTKQRDTRPMGDVVLSLRQMTVRENGRTVLGPLDLDVRAGEVLGVAGVEGNGQRELVGVVVGSVAFETGHLAIRGIDCSGMSILERRAHLAYVPAERKTAGGSVDSSITENVTMTHHRLDRSFSTFCGLLRWSRAKAFAHDVVLRFDVESKSITQKLGSLSGGNQQKVILGRELSEPRALTVLDQPTRGLDVGAIEFVHETILEVRRHGGAVVLVSADLGELLRLSDTIAVLHRGQIVDLVSSAEATMSSLGIAMLEGTAVR
jgi:general nucleoside transport system ATP-binding protein